MKHLLSKQVKKERADVFGYGCWGGCTGCFGLCIAGCTGCNKTCSGACSGWCGYGCGSQCYAAAGIKVVC